MFLENLKKRSIILASGSPRRLELMQKLDIPFTVKLKEVEEIYPDHLKRDEITSYLAKLKAKPFLEDMNANEVLISSDTIVWHKETALGKPKDKQDAVAMLQSLSGNSHEVISSICISTIEGQHAFSDVTTVHFKELSLNEINYYVNNYNALDKAGAYGIQEWIGLVAVNKLEGSYFNVMGFPVDKLQEELSKL